MREEWFVELDVFRDEIPNIFHNESNLRLRWFDKEQARAAVQRPAEAFGVIIEDALVDQLIDDLSAGGSIEPAQIQIVCDTLWPMREEKRITLANYKTLGQQKSHERIARQVLLQRLEEQFETIDTEEQLQLLERLLLHLRTPPPPPFTKYVRDIVALVKVLETDESSLLALIAKLEKSRLVRTGFRDNLSVVELSHDYLVERLEELQGRVRTIWPRHLLKADMVAHTMSGQFMSPEHLAKLSASRDYLTLDARQTEFLFRSALAHGLEMTAWFNVASQKGVEVWKIIRDKISQDASGGKTFHAIDLLGDLIKTPEAIELLEWTLTQKQLVAYVIHALSLSETMEALKLLTRALDQDQLSLQAHEALNILSRFAKSADVSAEAKNALTHFAKSQRPDSHFDERTQDSYESTRLQSQTRRALEPPFGLITDRLNAGRIIPFLGAGSVLAWRKPQTPWEIGQSTYVPTAQELAQYLAEKGGLVPDEKPSLLQVSQYYSDMEGRYALHRELHGIFDNDFSPTPLHTFLAGLSIPLLIVTTGYDDLLERVFQQNLRPYDVVIQTTDFDGSLLWREHDTDTLRHVNARRLDLDVNRRTVIYKIQGSVNRGDPKRDQYIITEDDYLNFLTSMVNNRAMPAVFAEAFQTRSFLFLGYGLREWDRRMLMNLILQNISRLKRKSWAVVPGISEMELLFWRHHDVEAYDTSLVELVEQLRLHYRAI